MLSSRDEGRRKPRETPASIGRAFAGDVEWKLFGAGTKSYGEIAKDLGALEKHYVSKLKHHPALVLEIRRRIAENKLEQALLHRCPLSLCNARLKVLSNLGFDTVERKAHFYLLFARGALARGNKSAARRMTSQIIDELQILLEGSSSPLAEQCLAYGRKILNSIDHG
jgi:hypothetical protein